MNAREMQRRQLDARLSGLPREQPPAGGWVRTVRRALGMTLAQLGTRLGVSAPAIAELERREARGSVSVAKLRAAADALGCDLLIAFVPRVPLADMVHQQAVRKATEEQRRLLHTMQIENQGDGVITTIDPAGWLAAHGAQLWD